MKNRKTNKLEGESYEYHLQYSVDSSITLPFNGSQLFNHLKGDAEYLSFVPTVAQSGLFCLVKYAGYLSPVYSLNAFLKIHVLCIKRFPIAVTSFPSKAWLLHFMNARLDGKNLNSGKNMFERL
ncbi:MAG TPA: hypothetical protein PKI01_10390 [Bacteroidales bacterium]|nr:hypothetical protein [Bacteroidales bacterium]